jgi:hypothetical protein
MQKRFALLKRLAEGPDWERYVVEAASKDALPAVETAGIQTL